MSVTSSMNTTHGLDKKEEVKKKSLPERFVAKFKKIFIKKVEDRFAKKDLQ